MQTNSHPGDQLISDAYRAQQIDLHETHPSYGSASVQWAPTVAALIKNFQVRSVLDYGSGKGRLLMSLKLEHPELVEFQMYEPAVVRFNVPPDPAELVCCIDVAEHVEPEYTEAFLDDLQRLARRIAFITVHCGPAVKVLADGRNAHLVQKPPSWWIPKLLARFDLLECSKSPGGFVFIGHAKGGVA